MKEVFIVLPGWTQTERSYERLIETAPENYQIIVAHHHEIIPGANITDFIDNFRNFLKKRQIAKTNLIGHSLGGALALEFCLHHPEMVKNLYLVDSAGVYGGETNTQLVNNLFKNLIRKGSAKLPLVFRNFANFTKRLNMHIKLGKYAFKVDLQNRMHKIAHKTIILWGEKDQLTPLWQGKRLHELIKGSKLVVLKEMDHDWILHSPQLFWQNIF